jgi:hypothetical protein
MNWQLALLFLLAVSGLLIADYLAHESHVRRVRRKRLEARIEELRREDLHRRDRLAELQTLNTRGRAQ